MTLIQLTDTIKHYRRLLDEEKAKYTELYTTMTACVGKLSAVPSSPCCVSDRVSVTVTRLEPVKAKMELYENTLKYYTDIFTDAAGKLGKRGELIKAIYLDGMSTGGAAKKIGMSRRWVYKYRDAAEKEMNALLAVDKRRNT